MPLLEHLTMGSSYYCRALLNDMEPSDMMSTQRGVAQAAHTAV
jgi:hypothetical protein